LKAKEPVIGMSTPLKDLRRAGFAVTFLLYLDHVGPYRKGTPA
jgi:hypothetical protein